MESDVKIKKQECCLENSTRSPSNISISLRKNTFVKHKEDLQLGRLNKFQ